MLALAVAEGSRALSKRWVLKWENAYCLIHGDYQWITEMTTKDRKREMEGQGRGEKNRWLHLKICLVWGFPYYSFQGVLVLAAPKDLAVTQWSCPASISIAQIQKNYTGTFLVSSGKKLSGPCSLSLRATAKLSPGTCHFHSTSKRHLMWLEV